MEFFFDSFLANPLFYIGATLAIVAAIGFLMFLGGFMSGIMPALKDNGNSAYISHQRMYVIWGLYLLIITFILWRVVSWIASAF